MDEPLLLPQLAAQLSILLLQRHSARALGVSLYRYLTDEMK